MWSQIIYQFGFQLFTEAICLFTIKQTCRYINYSQTIIKITQFRAQIMEISLFLISICIFSLLLKRLPIFLTTFFLMTILLSLWIVTINRTRRVSISHITRKSTLLSPTITRKIQPIKREYSSEIQSPRSFNKFLSFSHSTPNQLSIPNLDQFHLNSSPKLDSKSSISPILPIPETNQTKSNVPTPPDEISLKRSPMRHNLSPRQNIGLNSPNRSPHNVNPTFVNTHPIVSSQISKSTLNTRYETPSVLPPKLEPSFKLRTFPTSTSNFNFWTNQIMRHIITPFSSTPPKRTEGPCGLRNHGNICFLNSIFQSLVALPIFKSKLIEYSENDFGAFTRLIGTMTSLMVDSDSQVHDPIHIIRELYPFAHILSNPDSYIVMQSQQDAGEFFLFLIDALNSAFQAFQSPCPVSEEVTNKAIELYSLSPNLDFSDVNILHELRLHILKKLEKAVVSNGETYALDLAILAELEWRIYARKHSTPLYQLFCGQLVEARYCMTCQGLSLNLESFTLLPLSIPDTSKVLVPIEEILERFSRVEGLFGREKLRCERCEHTTEGISPGPTTNGLQDAQRRALLTKLPEYLIIQLSRFHYDPIQRFPYKNNKQISFPLKGLDLSQVFYESVVNAITRNCIYDLRAVVLHSNGSTALSGHYIAYTKNSNKWWLCNDSIVSSVDMDLERSSKYVLENAYILFYAKQDSI